MYSLSFISSLRRVWHYFRYMDTAFTFLWQNLSSRSLIKLRNDSGTSKELPSPPSPLAAPTSAISSRNLAWNRLLYLAHRWWRETTGCNLNSWLESSQIRSLRFPLRYKVSCLPFWAPSWPAFLPKPDLIQLFQSLALKCSAGLDISMWFLTSSILLQNIPQGPFFFHPQGKGF